MFQLARYFSCCVSLESRVMRATPLNTTHKKDITMYTSPKVNDDDQKSSSKLLQHETAQAEEIRNKKTSSDDEVIHQSSRRRRDMDDDHGFLGAPYYS